MLNYQAVQEAGLMATLRHPNIVEFLGLCLVPPCLVSEYCPRGSLYDIMKEARASPKLEKQLTWARRLSIVSHSTKACPLGPCVLAWALRPCLCWLGRVWGMGLSVGSWREPGLPCWV